MNKSDQRPHAAPAKRAGVKIAGGAALLAAATLGYAQFVARADGASPPAPRAALAVPPTSLGMNLGVPSYWSSEWAFSDIVQTSGGIIFQSPQGKWDPLVDQVRRDAGGHPVDVPAGTKLNIMIQRDAPRVPTGVYDCRIDRGWAVRPFGEWKMSPLSSTKTGQQFRMTVTKPESATGIVLLLTATANGAALTGLGCTAQGSAGTFNPLFLADLKPFSVIRYMDWMRANDPTPRTWATRTTPAAFSQAGGGGVAIEHIVALSNQTGSDPWINLPLDADPGYYRAMATYVRDHLAPGRRVYVELSNEVWNTGFAQGKLAAQRGAALYPSATPSEQSDFYYADRVREAMGEWSAVFRGQEKRLVRVLASQQINPRRAEQALSHNETWRSVDALATAPYFGGSSAEVPAAPGAARVDAIFAKGPQIVATAITESLANKATAVKYGLRYIAYEGGPGFAHPRPDLLADSLAVQKDPRMYDLYRLFLNRWKKEVGDVLVLFDSVSTPGRAGYYGHREYTGQPLDEAPKARALVDFRR